MSGELYLVRHCEATGQEPEARLTESGRVQAIELATRLHRLPIGRILSSPFTRAVQSITPLAERLGILVEEDPRLVERVLSTSPLPNWRQALERTFLDLDLTFEGGESSRTAMMRAVVVVERAMQQSTTPVAIVTHGNLMALIMKRFDDTIGFDEWANLENPDVYRLQHRGNGVSVEKLSS